MGIIYDGKDGMWVECRTKSFAIGGLGGPENYYEADYEQLDELERLVKLLQEKRRDKEPSHDPR